MNSKALSIAKKLAVIYWLSVLLVLFLFWDSQFGMKYILFGVLILVIHAGETFIFNKVLQQHSNNVLKDKLLMLPFGMMIPLELKAKAQESKTN